MRPTDATPTPPAARFSAAACLAAAATATALTALVAVGARTWIDRPFAGFFVRADRTVAAVGRLEWPGVTPARLYDRTLVAIDGMPLADSDDLYRRLAVKPLGSPFAYTLTDGRTTETVVVPSRRFVAADYWAVFGAYFTAGLGFVLLAIVAAWMRPGDRVGWALAVLGGTAGIFLLASADLHPPGASLRAQTLAGALLPAALLQFALAVGDARGRFARVALPLAWTLAGAAAVSMQLLLGDPAVARAVQACVNLALGFALAAAASGLAARVRVAGDGARLVAATALFGLGVPAIVCLVAGTLGGVPQNASATLVILFPLGMAIALVRGDATLPGGVAPFGGSL